MSTHVRVIWLEVMREGEEVLGDRDEVMMRDGRWRRFAGVVICCVQKSKKEWPLKSWRVEEWLANAEEMSLHRVHYIVLVVLDSHEKTEPIVQHRKIYIRQGAR